jgi:hypothetical protein
MTDHLIVNGELITAKEFAWDICHKIYLIDSDAQREEFVDYGYEILPIRRLRAAYAISCPLKFIYHGDTVPLVRQSEDADFSTVKSKEE